MYTSLTLMRVYPLRNRQQRTGIMEHRKLSNERSIARLKYVHTGVYLGLEPYSVYLLKWFI